MRVLHISNDYYNSGVYRTLHRGFLQSGMDSTFFVPVPYGTAPHGDAHVIEAPCFHKYDRYLYMNKQRKVYREVRKAVEALRPGLLHGYFLFSAGIHCLWAKREFGIPYVITVQNTDVNVIYRRFVHLRGLAREILREASMVCFVSNAYRNFTLEHMVPEEARAEISGKFRLLPFAVDPFWTDHTDDTKHPAHDGPIRLLTVGVVNASKNQLRTAEAVEKLREKGIDAELTVIGAAQDPDIDARVCSHAFVRRIPNIPKEQLIEEYRRADVFVLPSLAESFGLVYAEALTQGLPIIYSAGQGFDEQFAEGFAGYRVDARDSEQIAAGIQRVLTEYDRLQPNCGEAAAKFTQDAVCRSSQILYEEILSAQSKGTEREGIR